MPESADAAPEPIRLEIVGAGNAWWVHPGAGPSDISTYVFLDVDEHPELLELPDLARDTRWSARAERSDDGMLIRVQVASPRRLILEIPAERPELEAVRRARTVFVCPTTRALGIDPRLARDRSIPVRFDASGSL
jgi:hypothetical protein